MKNRTLFLPILVSVFAMMSCATIQPFPKETVSLPAEVQPYVAITSNPKINNNLPLIPKAVWAASFKDHIDSVFGSITQSDMFSIMETALDSQTKRFPDIFLLDETPAAEPNTVAFTGLSKNDDAVSGFAFNTVSTNKPYVLAFHSDDWGYNIYDSGSFNTYIRMNLILIESETGKALWRSQIYKTKDYGFTATHAAVNKQNTLNNLSICMTEIVEKSLSAIQKSLEQ